MTEFELLLVLLILLGVAGSAFTLLLFVAVLVGGTRDLLYRWRDRIEESRHSHGLCTRCGYDLRFCAHVRCPECGRSTSVILRYPEGSGPDRPGTQMLRSTSA